MSATEGQSTEKNDYNTTRFGKLSQEIPSEFVFCKPHLMPLKSLTLERLENMQKLALQKQKENRAKTTVDVDE